MIKSILWACLFFFSRQLLAQLPAATFTSPANGDAFSTASITIKWKGCSNATQSSYQTRINGVALVTSQANGPACPDYSVGKKYTASGTLSPGLNTLFVSVCDVSGCGQSTITVIYTAPAISVTPDGGAAPSVSVNETGTYSFKVKNTGGQTGTANISVSCTSFLTACSVTPSSASLAMGDSVTATVSYTGSDAGTGRMTVTANYSQFPATTDNGYVDAIVSRKPTATFTSHSDGQSVTNPNITIAWKGCSNAAQTSYQTVLNQGPNPLSTTQSASSPCPDYTIGKNYSAAATLLAGPNNLYASVCDVSGCGNKSITVTYVPPAISVTPDGASAQAIPPGAPGSFSFKVKNTGGPSGTAVFTVSCSPELNLCSANPTSASLAAGDSTTVVVSYNAAMAGTARATLTGTYNEFPGTTDNGYVDVPVLEKPSVHITSPTNGQTFSNPNITITWRACRNATEISYSTQLNGASIGTTESVDSGCTGYSSVSNYSASATLIAGVNTIVANECDALGCGRDSISVSYSPPNPANVSVTPDAGSGATLAIGQAGSYAFKVKNTGGQTATALLTAGCTAELSSCSVSPTSSSITAGDSITATVSYSGSSVGSGRVSLTATYSEFPAVSDSGYVTVNVASQTSPLTILSRNAGTTLDKSGCLTIAAGQNSAYECGDLRVVHSLPATITMDRSRAPALIYNSRHANPVALFAADVSYSGSTPDSLKATVTLAGQPGVVHSFAWNPACAATSCRIVVPVSTSQATGLYGATLDVSAMSGATILGTATTTDSVVVVNRTSSPYGSGWWLDGLESLVTLSGDRMLWIGGDGSARVYRRPSGSGAYTVSPSYDRPDSLTHDVTAGTWRRLLGDGAYVEFDSEGRQIRTVNALNWITSFAYNGGLLESITLPVPQGSSATPRYLFYYSASHLDSVRAPSASFARTTRFTFDGSARLSAITDPDGYSVTFGYDASNRITSRRNKLNDTNSFAYDDAGGLKRSSLDMSRTDGAGSAITTTFRAAETRGSFDASDSPTPVAQSYTHVDGPRLDVQDTTNFLVNRFGAPDTVTNALGERTRVERSNATFPALVTRIIAPNGFETRAFFNSRGLADSTLAVNPYGDNRNATTRYAWNPTWNQVDSVVGPEGDRRRTFYSASRAIPDSMRTGTDVNRKLAFSYTADNQLRSVREADGGPDSVVYDALGNTIKTYTPVGRAAASPYFTQLVKDAIGRDTLVVRAISSAVNDSSHFTYDAADRIVRTTISGPARPYSLPLNASFQPDTAAVTALARTDTTGYDAEGNLVYKRSLSEPDYNSQLNEQMTYDAAGRLKSRRVGSGPDSLVYDPAGNVVTAKQRSGAWVTQSFDVLNRLVQRAVPEVTHASERCTHYSSGPLSGPGSCLMIFPYYPNSGDALRIPADTSRFTYDVAGNMLTASNRYARVRRTYFPIGAIESDTTTIGSYASPLVDDQKKGQKYSYDLAGRRTSMLWDQGQTGYRYNDIGALSSVTDPSSNVYRFTYDLKGRLDSLILGTGVRENRAYDDDGRLIFKERVSDSEGLGLLVSDSLSYDRADRLTRAWQEAHDQTADQTLISYDGLGAVIAREQANQYGSNVEEFRYDAFGNMIRKMNRRSAGLVNTAPFTLSYSPKGELTAWNTTLSQSSGQYDRSDNLHQDFLSGKLLRQDEIIQDPNTGAVSLELAARHYYSADDKLMAVQRYSYKSTFLRDGTWEEYWYDALGRRILTRARRESSSPYDATVSGPLCQALLAPTCRSFTERVWWDGDQSLVEVRTPEGTSDVSNSGTVANIHALSLDEPLAVITTNPSVETRIIVYNWRGQAMSSVFPNGDGADYVTGSTSAEVDWPAQSQAETYFTPSFGGQEEDYNPRKWLGTFVQNGQGTTGMLYRRNRYFDSNTGRFTQEDPIGIAGGVNQYGFASGDPVNFADPFGLCGEKPSDYTPRPEPCPGEMIAIGAPITIAAGNLIAAGEAIGLGVALLQKAASDLFNAATTRIGRYMYERDVRGLAKQASKMREAGASDEEIANSLVSARRAIGQAYKNLTPEPLRSRIYQRNLQKYGDQLGPTVQWLRANGKSWQEIIESASRPGGKDIFR